MASNDENNWLEKARAGDVEAFGALVLALLLGTLGLAGVGTLFAAIAAHTRAREVLLPLLLFPIQVPVILATVKSTGAAIRVPGLDPPDVAQWLGLLVAFIGESLMLRILLDVWPDFKNFDARSS